MDRTRSNLTLAALLLAVGYIVGQAVGPHHADASVAPRAPGDQIVTTANDYPGHVIVWEFAGHRVVRATSYSLKRTEEGQPITEATEYAAPTSAAPPR